MFNVLRPTLCPLVRPSPPPSSNDVEWYSSSVLYCHVQSRVRCLCFVGDAEGKVLCSCITLLAGYCNSEYLRTGPSCDAKNERHSCFVSLVFIG